MNKHVMFAFCDHFRIRYVNQRIAVELANFDFGVCA